MDEVKRSHIFPKRHFLTTLGQSKVIQSLVLGQAETHNAKLTLQISDNRSYKETRTTFQTMH
jgi:hypothetical protein